MLLIKRLRGPLYVTKVWSDTKLLKDGRTGADHKSLSRV